MRVLLVVFGVLVGLVAAIFVTEKTIPLVKKYIKKYLTVN